MIYLKPYAVFLCALTVILLAFSPFLILSFYQKLPLAEQYKGILTLLHISDWRTAGSSVASFLEKCILQFEACNPHVFIDLVCLSKDDAAEALTNGFKPDIISYPYGFAAQWSFAALPPANHCFNPGAHNAYPYLCGGYCAIVNTDMLNEKGVEIADDWGIRPEELLNAAKLGICFDSEKGYTSLPALAKHQYPDVKRPDISTFEKPEPADVALNIPGKLQNGLQCFCDEQAAVLIASHRQLFEVWQQFEHGQAPGFKAYAIGGYTDMVQMIGVSDAAEQPKLKACQQFAVLTVSGKMQRRVAALGVFPVAPGIEIYSDDGCKKAMCELLCQNAAFGDPNMLHTLNSLAEKAFRGDKNALKTLRNSLISH